MSNSTDSEANCCSFLWKIVNISHCWLNLGECLDSPVFVADALGGTRWLLRLFPNQNEEVIIYPLRTLDCSGPQGMDVHFTLCLMDEDEKPLIESAVENKYFIPGQFSSEKRFDKERIFVTEKEIFLPEDTLTILCTMCKKAQKEPKSKIVSAQTVFKVNRRSIFWKIPEFQYVKPGIKNRFKSELIDFDLILEDFENTLLLSSNSIDEKVKYFSFKAAILNSELEKKECWAHEYFKNDLREQTFSTRLYAKLVLDNKNQYLLKNALILECEMVCSTGTVLNEYCVSGLILAKAQNEVIEKENPIEKEEPQRTLALANDFKSMFNDKDFSDVELRTSTKTFAAHKNILSARSPVFKRMFSNDMRENSSGHVDIEDLEDDAVHRMLLYMYTDLLEDLQFANVCKLYVAADKYEILSLRSRCSSYLKGNLCPNKACDILVLADRHQDEDLKSAAQDFILRHNEVFGSEEWKELMATNLKVAADVMYRKVYSA